MTETVQNRVPHTVNDYAVLPILLPSTKAYPTQALHYLYLRAHAPKLPTAETDQELFLVNIPIDTTSAHIRALFASDKLGNHRISRISLDDDPNAADPATPSNNSRKRKRRSTQSTTEVSLPSTWDRVLQPPGATCVVTFVDSTSAASALRHASRLSRSSTAQLSWPSPASSAPLGLARYTAHQRLVYPSESALQANVDAYMLAFTARMAEQAREDARKRAEPDEDGFVTVTRGGRTNPAREEEAARKLEKQREKMKGKDDFYRFQMRERRKGEARRLVVGFEEERRRVLEGRKRRRPE